MKQRSEQEHVAELQAKIDAIKMRGEKKRARANPAVRLATVALKSIDKAARETDDATAKKALGEAREPLSAWLALEGLVLNAATKAELETKKRRKNNTAMAAS